MFRSFADVTPRGYQVVTPAGTAGVELLRNAALGSAMREVGINKVHILYMGEC